MQTKKRAWKSAIRHTAGTGPQDSQGLSGMGNGDIQSHRMPHRQVMSKGMKRKYAA